MQCFQGACCCWCWDNHYLFPRLYRVAWEKGCGCGERWIILLKKKENKKPFLRNKNENQRVNLRKQTGQMGKMCEKHCDILHLSLHSWYKGLKKLSNNVISQIRVGIVWTREKLTKWMMPAAVSHTEMKIEMSWASLKSKFPWDLGSCYEGNLQLSSAVVKLSRLLWIQMPLGHLDVRQASPCFCHFYPPHCELL